MLAVSASAMAPGASLAMLGAALVTFPALRWRRFRRGDRRGGAGKRRAIRTDSKRRISCHRYGFATLHHICAPPMQLAGATPDPRGAFPPSLHAEGHAREGARTRGRARRGRPRAPGPLPPCMLQYVTTCPNIQQHRRPRPRGGRPRPTRGRSWACSPPPPRRREGRRGRGPGST